ncbi:MAG: sigma-70 family RNA polymerase sigma factor [Candidatus Latescibacteria bacterium]|nr:sigma-70 family RNA polymerase sigma factor [Candidatus Latescibacterota bacterium]
MDDEERIWILKAQNGDQRAFEALVNRYDRRVLGLAYGMVGDAEDAQDVFQETFIAAYRALPGFRMESDFFTWLYRIAVNKALSFRRNRARQAPPLAGNSPLLRGRLSGPEEILLDEELRRQIEAALDGLSKHERMAFVLCHHQGFKIRQAAEVMGCSEGSVKSFLFRSRAKVKLTLQKYMES